MISGMLFNVASIATCARSCNEDDLRMAANVHTHVCVGLHPGPGSHLRIVCGSAITTQIEILPLCFL